MKNIITLFLFSISLLSCKSNTESEIKDIEMMGYYYLPSNSQKELKTDAFLYASIDTTGTSKNLRKIDSINFVGYEFDVNKQIIDNIINKTQDKDESYFEHKIDTTHIKLYCGPIIRFRISYTNGKELSFYFNDENYSKDSKYYLFKALYDELINNPKTDIYNLEQLNSIKLKQQKFAKYSIHRDTLLLPFPPMPIQKIDEVKFVKK